jgi:glycosyltransferase involved in cell wall biosynthesis
MSDAANRTAIVPVADPAGAVLLDVTRLVAARWSARQPTGIDRVCAAYLAHFRDRAHAVVQHRGVIRVLGSGLSAQLFDLIATAPVGYRPQLAALLALAITRASPRPPHAAMPYLNAGDTDFDLPAHCAWTRHHAIRPFYVIHDLIPTLQPQFSRPHAVQRHRGRVRSALTTGAGIVVGSQAVKRDLLAYAAAEGLPLPPLVVAPLAGAPLPASAPPPPDDGQPFFLTVGTVEPRKNHRLLFAAWRMLADRLGPATPRLVLAGQTGPLTGELLAPLTADPALRRLVVFRPECSDADLAGLLHHARALLVPSLAEGFGLPVVEALQAGTPVIASDLPVFREIGQGLPLLLDPHEPSAWADAIASLALCGQSDAGGGTATGPRGCSFVPPRWSDHFAVVERFIATPGSCCEPLTERVLAA